jgi:hypothetical protein
MLKKIAVILIITVLFTPPVWASDVWTKNDIRRELVYALIVAVDVTQTTGGNVTDPGAFRERNPILGSHPSDEKIISYALAGLVGHGLIVNYLPTKYRAPFQSISILIHTTVIIKNEQIGGGLRASW